jgi:F0F1-type ATP synthase assembly protein I
MILSRRPRPVVSREDFAEAAAFVLAFAFLAGCTVGACVGYPIGALDASTRCVP